MLSNLFDNVNLLRKGLDAAWKRNEVTMNNIANVDTPGFKSSSVGFEAEMERALAADEFSFSAKTTRPEHYKFASNSVEDVTPTVIQNTNTSYRMDGNNVDIDYENVQLAKNSIWYSVLIEKVSSEFRKLKTVINR